MNNEQRKELIRNEIKKNSKKMSESKFNKNLGGHTYYQAISTRKVLEIIDKYL